MTSLVSDITQEALRYAYNQFQKKSNQRRISIMIDVVSNMAIRRIQPYMYAIMAILIIMFLLNCFQFYYYLRYIVINTSKYDALPGDSMIDSTIINYPS
jgi:hypothetical protein